MPAAPAGEGISDGSHLACSIGLRSLAIGPWTSLHQLTYAVQACRRRFSSSAAAAAPPQLSAAFMAIGDELLSVRLCACSGQIPDSRLSGPVHSPSSVQGSVTDVNLSWLAQMLHRQARAGLQPGCVPLHQPDHACCCCSRGVDLVRAEFVPDDKADIVATLQRLKERVGPEGVVFSSGGIGPTHDDVSYEAVATALGACAAGLCSRLRQMQSSRAVCWQGSPWSCTSPPGSACR